jgi:RimJ/RimL family protein N-acetyltransferase
MMFLKTENINNIFILLDNESNKNVQCKTKIMELKKDNLKLRAFQESDAEQIALLCNNKKIWDNVRDYLPFPYNVDHAIEYIHYCQGENPQTTFAVEYKGEFVGSIGLLQQTDVYRLTAEVGYWIGEPYWGLGIATNALQLITDYGFKTLGLVRIYSGVFDFNKASQRVLEKAGFKLEGIFEKSILKNGTIGSEYRYGLIKK